MTPIYACTLFYIENGKENMMLFPTSTMQENLHLVVWVFLVFQRSQYKEARISPHTPTLDKKCLYQISPYVAQPPVFREQLVYPKLHIKLWWYSNINNI